MSRIWVIIAAVLSIGILVLGWFVGIAPKLGEWNTANEQRAAVEAQNVLHEQRLAALKADYERIDELREILQELQVQLPPGDDLSTFVGMLHVLEQQSGVSVTRIFPNSAMPYAASPNAIKTNLLLTGDNFIVIPIELEVSGTREQVLAFVSALQFNEEHRLFLVQNLTVAQNDSGGTGTQYAGTISGFVYVLVDPTAPPPAPTPPEPTTPATGSDSNS